MTQLLIWLLIKNENVWFFGSVDVAAAVKQSTQMEGERSGPGLPTHSLPITSPKSAYWLHKVWIVILFCLYFI